MFNRLFSIFARSQRRKGANGWWREDNDFVKFKRLGDGEVTSLLVGDLSDDQISRIYSEIKDLSEKKQSAFQTLVVSYAFAVVAFFGFSESFEIAGLDFSVEIVPHVSVVLMNFAGWSFSTINSRLGYLTTYFEYLYFSRDSAAKAKFLLDYPLAIPPFLFHRTIRGFPRYIQPNCWPIWENIALFGLMFVVLAGAIIATTVNLYGLWLVWSSNFPTPVFSRCLVVAMVLSGFFVWANPVYTNLKRKYRHYGMSDTLTRLPEHRKREYHRRMAIIQIKRDGIDDRIP